MFQNGTNWMDGTTGITQCPVPPGQSFLYNFTVNNQYGTYWYHAHFSTQYVDGIVGPLIVHAPEESETRKLYDFDQVVLLQDWYHDLTSALTPKYLSSGNENAEPVPDNGVIQGQNYFNCSSYGPDSGYQCSDDSARSVFAVESGKRYRLRLVNTGAFTPFQISIDNHALQVIEADGTIVDPLSVHRLEVAVAERYSVVLTANQSASTNYWLRAQMNTNCYAASNPVLDPLVFALVTYKNTTDEPTASADWADALDVICQDLNNTLLSPTEVQQAPPADALFEIAFSFGIGDYALSRALVNGTTWTPSTNNPTLQQAVTGLHAGGVNASELATTGTLSKGFSADQFVIGLPESVRVADVLIVNFDDGSHPFHLHGHVFWVMATSSGQYFPWGTDLYAQLNSSASNGYTANPMRRDTITLPAYSWALIRFRNDNPGMWALHCHNAWHMEAGLMAQLLSQQEKVAGWTVPADVVGLCRQ
jgi:FtsP/CotA-like multicopper oxidase with cupredoxin domain